MTDEERRKVRDAALNEAQSVCYRIFERYWDKQSEFERKRHAGQSVGQWENDESPIWYKAKQHAADECRRAIHELTDEYKAWESRKLAELAAKKENA